MKTKTCPYCGSNLEKMKDKYYCSFCVMTLAAASVKENRERLEVKINDFTLTAYTDKTTPELMVLSTFELLYLLKEIRQERGSMYSHMNTFRKAGEETETEEFKQIEEETGKQYMHLTKKAFVVENILRKRLDYVPDRITENSLIRHLDNIKKDKKRPMVIRTKRKSSSK
ncbi:hypothetical protein [Metabacillus fastidiosus]|uniref:hypothetical protein n=1 Tax=Metabacillus fastidiosus TaxID=1458 RepID=UPI002E1E6A67|nr:hypothetical protein [Metabacillus fastidiosus]